MSERTVSVINVFTPKADQFDEFIDIQTAALPGFRDKVPGLRGSRFYRSVDGRTAVLITVFASPEHLQEFVKSEAFTAHRARISPLLERADPGTYEMIYEGGDST